MNQIIRIEQKVVNGAVREVRSYNWPKVQYSDVHGNKEVREWPNEVKMDWLIRHNYSERSAYMIAYNVSEAEMKRIEND